MAEKVNLFACEVTGEVVRCLGTFLKHGSAVVKRVSLGEGRGRGRGRGRVVARLELYIGATPHHSHTCVHIHCI